MLGRERNLLAGAAIATLGMASGIAWPADTDSVAAKAAAGPSCETAGPQTPRDIDKKAGTNKVAFATAPRYQDLNLCNIHFHAQAEHKAKAFSIVAAKAAANGEAGFQCSIGRQLSAAELKKPDGDICKGLKPGDTIEVHWVHSSCDVKPGAGLGSCVSDACKEPKLRVEAQVYTLVNDPKAAKFQDVVESPAKVHGRYHAKAIPANTGKPVQFAGSTTGPSYDNAACSPLQVTWSVRPQCAKLDINSLGAWCRAGNVFQEDHAHGVRKLVTDSRFLAPISR
jgi:hypothetical protein